MNSLNATKLQILFRFLIVISLYVLASYYLFGLPLIVSMLMVMFTKERLSLCDLLCSNYVVDSGKYEGNIPEKDQILIVYDDGKENKIKGSLLLISNSGKVLVRKANKVKNYNHYLIVHSVRVMRFFLFNTPIKNSKFRPLFLISEIAILILEIILNFHYNS